MTGKGELQFWKAHNPSLRGAPATTQSRFDFMVSQGPTGNTAFWPARWSFLPRPAEATLAIRANKQEQFRNKANRR
jgi:hypothetical protein